MKPIGNCHCTPVRANPLIKEVVGRKELFDPGSHQACGNNGHDGSRMHLLDCQSPEENDHTPSEARVTGELQDGLNDNKGREELIEVAEDVVKHTVNGNKGRDELLEVVEVVEKQSINDSKGTEELVEVAEDVEMQSIPEGTELHEEAGVSAQECQVAAQVPEATPEYPIVENQVQSCPEQEPGDDLRPPSPENLSMAYQDHETQRSEPTASRDHTNIPQEATSGAGENVLLDEGNSDEVSAIHVSDPIDVKPSSPSQVQGNNSPLHSVCDSTPPESRSNPQVEMQVHSQAPMQQALPVNVAYSQNATSAGNWPQMYYVQSSQSQQWHVQPQLTPGGTTNTQMVVAQGYPYQSQAWTGTLDQKANQAFGQYQMATAQVYPIGNLSWPGQNVQQQAYAYVQSQSATQPQPQPQPPVDQQSAQSNEQQFGYLQNSQGISPHIWQYYQQQHYYLQQQQLQSQQLQYSSQQEQKIDQQMNPQQQQLHLNQQISSQQQQPQQNEQSSQQLQQHQLAQYQQQNQQVHNTQQYQQLLYMQQQQQQQLYLQQQQQCYQQQQQLLQQQQFQQLSQQEQQLLLQQLQQLLLQQQQQQLLQLQQQHHQQLQQLQQQSVQQQQLQQQPVVQQQQSEAQPVVQQQHQQISASDLKALNINYIQVLHFLQKLCYSLKLEESLRT